MAEWILLSAAAAGATMVAFAVRDRGPGGDTSRGDGAGDDGSRDALRAAGARYGQGYQSGDARLLDEVLADDYVFVALDGSALNKAEAIARWTDPARGAAAFTDTESAIRVYGDCAVVTGRQTEAGTVGGQAYSVAYRFTVVWARPKGRWQVVSEHLSAAGPAPAAP